MNLLARLLSALFLLFAAAGGARIPLANRVKALVESSPVARTAFWGIQVDDLDRHTSLVAWNSQHLFVPASNTKLFTTALALTSLGPEFRVATLVTSATEPDNTGTVQGDVTLLGAGDANLSGRPIPYDSDAPKLNPLTGVRDLAQQLFARGIRAVKGNVVGDDTRFLYEPFPPGWSIDDPIYSDGAPVSALCVNDSTIDLAISPAHLAFEPDLPVFTIENRIVAGAERAIHVSRDPGSSIVRLSGTIPPLDPGETEHLSVDDPARFAALALIAALRETGIAVTGTALARHRYPGSEFVSQNSIELARHSSPPLIEDLRVTDKISQNLHAELLLRLVGQGSRVDGLQALTEFVSQIGIAPESTHFADGSGLSRLNVVTPYSVVQLLSYMARGPVAAQFASLLPVSGVDGSLKSRFSGTRAQGKIFAKTGSLTHVSALSGYAVRRDGHRLAFSILVNNYNGPTAAIRAVIDRICALLVE